MRSMVYSNTAKPKREVCPRCSKKGIGIWHRVRDFPARDRRCQYCGYTEFQTFVIDAHTYRGTWKQTIEDAKRQASYNGEQQ